MDKKIGCSLGCFVSGYGQANWLHDVIMVAKNFTWVDKKTGCSLGCFVSGYGKANWLDDVITGCKELHMGGQENWMLTGMFCIRVW